MARTIEGRQSSYRHWQWWIQEKMEESESKSPGLGSMRWQWRDKSKSKVLVNKTPSGLWVYQWACEAIAQTLHRKFLIYFPFRDWMMVDLGNNSIKSRNYVFVVFNKPPKIFKCVYLILMDNGERVSKLKPEISCLGMKLFLKLSYFITSMDFHKHTVFRWL